MEAVIQGTIGALGYLEDGVYYPEPDCFESVRDLIRYLRSDGSDMLVRRVCMQHNVVGSDLIPILKSKGIREEMFDAALRLTANLCQPVAVSMLNKPAETKEQFALVRQLEKALTRAKLACADVELFRVLREKLSAFFIAKEWDDRTEEDRLVMERVVVFIRYMFAINPVDVDDKRTIYDSSSHDRLVEAAIDAGLPDLLMTVVSDHREREFHLSILEIFALILKEHRPEDIESAERSRTEEEKRRTEAELAQMVENQKASIDALKRKAMASRHTRFAGSYVVRGVRAVNSENDMFVNKPVKGVSSLDFMDTRKKVKRTPKNRKPFENAERTFISPVEIRLKMRTVVMKLIDSHTYNVLIRSTKDKACNSHRSVGQRCADLHFYLLQRFCLHFARLARLPAEMVSASLGVDGFHHVQVQLESYLENAQNDKKEGRRHGLRAQFCLSAYKELLLFNQYMLDEGTEDEKEEAKAAIGHIFKVEEYRELSAKLMTAFMPGVLSKTFLRELVLVNHHYLRLLEKSAKSGLLSQVTKKKKVRRKKTTKRVVESLAYDEEADKRQENAEMDEMKTVEAEEKWDTTVEEAVRRILQGEEEAALGMRPSDFSLMVEPEQHQRFAMLHIQRELRRGNAAEAVGIYRSARDVWPLEGVFGRSDMPLEDELSEMKAIMVTDLKQVSVELREAERKDTEVEYGDEEGYNSEDEDDERFERQVVDFDFKEHVTKFARNDVLKWYVFLLADYTTNSPELNHALVKLMHRVAFDLEAAPRLYQVSLFLVLDKVRQTLIGRSKEDLKKSAYFDIYQFGYHLLKKFFGSFVERGELIGVEALFWKTPKAVYEISFGYGAFDKTDDDKKPTWTEELEEELRGHYEDYRGMDERPEGMDVLDYIENSLSRERTRRQIARKMKELGLDTMGANTNKGSVKDRQFPTIEMKDIAAEFATTVNREDNETLPEHVKRVLEERGRGVFSKGKIVKMLAYMGIEWDGMNKKKPKLREWSEGLQRELAALKEQYEEEEEDVKGNVDIASYVHKRLSEKRPRREVEGYLERMGVAVERREKKPRKKRAKRGEKGRSSEGEGEGGESSGREEEEEEEDLGLDISSSDEEEENEEDDKKRDDEEKESNETFSKENKGDNGEKKRRKREKEERRKRLEKLFKKGGDGESERSAFDEEDKGETKKKRRLIVDDEDEDMEGEGEKEKGRVEGEGHEQHEGEHDLLTPAKRKRFVDEDVEEEDDTVDREEGLRSATKRVRLISSSDEEEEEETPKARQQIEDEEDEEDKENSHVDGTPERCKGIEGAYEVQPARRTVIMSDDED